MMHITFNNHKSTWYVGQDKPHAGVNQVESIQADGHELEHVIRLFTNSDGVVTIPYSPQKPVMQWFGDTAKTIFYAL